MKFTELNEQSHRSALFGLTQISRWALAQHAATEHAAEVEKLEAEIRICKARIEQAATASQREKAGELQTSSGGVATIYTGTGHGWLLQAVDRKEELANLERSKEAHERERASFLAVPLPGPDIVPGLATWIAEHFADRPEFRFKG